MYDVAIIGAGPAGATLARLAGSTYKVLLLEKRRVVTPPAGRADEKCCGGLIAPDAQRQLASLGLALPAGVLVGPQIFAVRTIDVQSGLERFYQRHYINVDRAAFDRWLVSLIPWRVDLREECSFRHCARKEGAFEITFSHRGRTFSEQARTIVGADGAGSLLRRRAGADPPAGAYVAIQESFEARHPLPYYSAIFDRSVTDFYCWTIPKGGRLLVGAALRPNRQPRRKFELLKCRLRDFGFDLRLPVARSAAKLLRPLSIRQLCPTVGALVFIGEAAGWISPSSAEGISYALRSAAAAAEALRGSPAGFAARSAAATRALKANMLLKILKARLIYSPAVRKLLMQSGLGSLNVKEGWAAPALPQPAVAEAGNVR